MNESKLKYFIILPFLIIFFSISYSQNSLKPAVIGTNTNNTKFSFRTINNEAFDVGETLEFNVRYGFIVAGKAVLTIPNLEYYKGRKSYYIESRVNSLPFFSTFYKVEDLYISVVDAEGIFPWRFEQHIKEGKYTRDFEAEFDHYLGIAKTSEGEYPIESYVHDIISAFYYTRTIDFSNMKPGQRITLKNFYKDTTYILEVKYKGKQQVEVKAGKFNCIVVEPIIQEGGLFKSEGTLYIWLTDDKRKIPVMVKSKILIGSITAELTKYSGINGEIEAKVK